MRTLLFLATALGWLCGPTLVHAGCGDRPGTPDQPQVQAYPNGHVYFSWRATHGRSEPELIMFYDVYVWEQATGRQTRLLTGVPPAFATQGPKVEGGIAVGGFPAYGERAGAYMDGAGGAKVVTDSGLVDQAARDELAESDGGREQGVVPGAGKGGAHAGGLTRKCSGRVTLP